MGSSDWQNTSLSTVGSSDRQNTSLEVATASVEASSATSSTRASATTARSVAASPELLASALEVLNSRVLAPGSAATKSSKLKLAEELASLAGYPSCYPLTDEILSSVGAALLAGGYTSGFSYIQEMKLQHLERNFEIGPAIARRLNQLDAALARGQGPPKRAPEVKPSELAFDAAVADDGGPICGSSRAFIVSSAWLLREIEAADLDLSARSVRLHADGSASLNVPMSKADQRGVGATRRLACTCRSNGDPLDRLIDEAPSLYSCGACAVRHQIKFLESTFGASLADNPSAAMPLFPTRSGDRPTKQEMISAWAFAAAGAPVTGHSARRSGAKSKARRAWTVSQIMFFGRWHSAAVMAYIEEALGEVTHLWAGGGAPPVLSAPAAALTAEPEVMLSLSARAEAAETQLANLRSAVSHVQEVALSALDSRIDALEDPSARPFIVVAEGKAHAMGAGVEELPRALWTSLCGWRCGVSSATRLLPWRKLDGSGLELCRRCEAKL